VGLRLLRADQGAYYVEDVVRFRGTPAEVERAVLSTATQDGRNMLIGLEQDPGQAGLAEVQSYYRLLEGYNVRAFPASGDKVTRSKPVSAQVEAGNVKLLRGVWNSAFLNELEGFPQGRHDDQVDALSGAFNVLVQCRSILVA
jgi:predicted phage terminase large subunit-like protein